jgi:hypothetical protein
VFLPAMVKGVQSDLGGSSAAASNVDRTNYMENGTSSILASVRTLKKPSTSARPSGRCFTYSPSTSCPLPSGPNKALQTLSTLVPSHKGQKKHTIAFLNRQMMFLLHLWCRTRCISRRWPAVFTLIEQISSKSLSLPKNPFLLFLLSSPLLMHPLVVVIYRRRQYTLRPILAHDVAVQMLLQHPIPPLSSASFLPVITRARYRGVILTPPANALESGPTIGSFVSVLELNPELNENSEER